jgi:hypothetical protein
MRQLVTSRRPTRSAGSGFQGWLGLKGEWVGGRGGGREEGGSEGLDL